MLNASLLVPMPPLLLLVGALVAARPPSRLASAQKLIVSGAALGALAAATALVGWLFGAPELLRFPVSPWSTQVFGGGPELRARAPRGYNP